MHLSIPLDAVKWRNELYDYLEEAVKIALPDGEVLQFCDSELKH